MGREDDLHSQSRMERLIRRLIHRGTELSLILLSFQVFRYARVSEIELRTNPRPRGLKKPEKGKTGERTGR